MADLQMTHRWLEWGWIRRQNAGANHSHATCRLCEGTPLLLGTDEEGVSHLFKDDFPFLLKEETNCFINGWN